MRFLPSTVIALTLLAASLLEPGLAKKPSRSRSAAPPSSNRKVSSSSNSRPPPSSSSGRAPVSRRRNKYEDEDEEEEVEEEEIVEPEGLSDVLDDGIDEDVDDVDVDDDEEEADEPLARGRASATSARRAPPTAARSKGPPPRSSAGPKKRPPVRRDYDDEEDEEEEYERPKRRSSPDRRGPPPRRPGERGPPERGERGPPSRGGRGPPPSSVVRYAKPQPAGAASAFTRGLAAIRSSMPDPAFVKDAALSSITAARETTSSLSANLYRDLKGLTSSELEQVMLKATKPDDTAVKSKHVERLVGVTYQISSRYDIYDAVLRKLWGKMVEKDWRTTLKALYILHRFSVDGAPEHAAALKARLRELRRTRDPKRKDKFFNSKQLLAGDAKPENIKFRAFMSRYAHYVLLRAQCFGGMFEEIAAVPKVDKKKPPKPITSTSLRVENLDAAMMILKAAIPCQLKDGEECENTAIAVERVAADLIGLTSIVAAAINRAFKDTDDDDLKGADPALLKRWCVFYSEELLPQTKAMVKKTLPKLDAYGLFLPSRMGASVPPEILERGLNLDNNTAASTGSEEGEASSSSSSAAADESAKAPADEDEVKASDEAEVKVKKEATKPVEKKTKAQSEVAAKEEAAAAEDDYEYDEEYYDEEDE